MTLEEEVIYLREDKKKRELSEEYFRKQFYLKSELLRNMIEEKIKHLKNRKNKQLTEIIPAIDKEIWGLKETIKSL